MGSDPLPRRPRAEAGRAHVPCRRCLARTCTPRASAAMCRARSPRVPPSRRSWKCSSSAAGSGSTPASSAHPSSLRSSRAAVIRWRLGSERLDQDVDAEHKHPRREDQLDPWEHSGGEQKNRTRREAEDGEPPRRKPKASGDRCCRDGKHRGHPHRIDGEQREDDAPPEWPHVRCRSVTHREHQPTGNRAGGEQHGDEEESAAQEHRRKEAVLGLPDPVADHSDEPEK